MKGIFNFKERKFDIILFASFFIGILLISATYAWFSASLDASVNFIDMKINTESGLYISLDGEEFTSNIQISKETVIEELNEKYPTHMNQWSGYGLYPLSSAGIPHSDTYLFDIFGISKVMNYFDNGRDIRIINTHKVPEKQRVSTSLFLAFDIFLKSISNSPMPDNLFIGESTNVVQTEGTEADGTVNSLRIGMSKVGTVHKTSTVEERQTVTCNNKCESIIYEPNAYRHSKESIERLEEMGISIFDGRLSNTFAVIGEGKKLSILNGQIGTGIPLDLIHFKVQDTVTTKLEPIFKLPSGITKFRVYIWVEGQDLDSLETISEGTKLDVNINLRKDISGYEYYD